MSFYNDSRFGNPEDGFGAENYKEQYKNSLRQAGVPEGLIPPDSLIPPPSMLPPDPILPPYLDPFRFK